MPPSRIASHHANALRDCAQVRGLAHGDGICLWDDGDHGGRTDYAGQFENGVRSGIGVMRFADGTRYEGQWKAGKPAGYGNEAYPDGSKYTGHFQGDKRHGLGVYAFPDDSVYAGNWRDGKQDGLGLRTVKEDTTLCTFKTCVAPPTDSLLLRAFRVCVLAFPRALFLPGSIV